MKIGHPKDFWSGIMFVVIGILFALVAKGLKMGDTVLIAGYAMGVPARMGPAFFPFWLGLILIALGLLIAFLGIKAQGGPEARFPRFHWRPILFILGSVVLFGIVLKWVGMIVAGLLLVFVSSMGNTENFEVKTTLFLGLGLVVFCTLVFVVGLKLPIPLCPDVESIRSAIPLCRG